jgi:hypothetical protein
VVQVVTHVTAENWLNDMEEFLEATRCTDSENVPYTTFKLFGEAKRQWQAKKALLILELGSEQAITWEMFKDEFNKHFFHILVQEVKAKEFMGLVQRGMSVTEYASKFI